MATNDVIGLIPCGGLGSRIAPLPCSKEILPVGLSRTANGGLRPKVVSRDLLENMRQGGVRKIFFILRKGKWDIPAYYGDGSSVGMNTVYLIAGRPYGPPYTLDQAYPFVHGSKIAFGFPDILLGPRDAFRRALERLEATHADLLLGLYRLHGNRPSDMIVADRMGRVHGIILEPRGKKPKRGWIFAVWTPAFTEFLHDYLKMPRTSSESPGSSLPSELTVGHVIEAALRAGIATQSIYFPRHTYLDIGTPEGLAQALDERPYDSSGTVQPDCAFCCSQIPVH